MTQAWTLVLMLPLNADMELVFAIYPCIVGKVVWRSTDCWEIISPVQVRVMLSLLTAIFFRYREIDRNNIRKAFFPLSTYKIFNDQ